MRERGGLGLEQSFADWPLRRAGRDGRPAYAALAAAGFRAVEMARPERWQDARAAGLELLSVAGPRGDARLTCGDDHDAVVSALRGAVDAAGRERIRQLIMFSGERRGEPDAAGIASCARGLAAIAPRAASAGVTLLLELLNTDDHPDYHASSSAFVFEVVRRVDSPSVRALYDVYHATRMGEPVLDDLAANAPLVGHVHVAGAPLRDFPGAQQEIDYARVVAAARRAGYEGGWGHEFLARGDPVDELRRARALFDRHVRAAAAA